MSAIRTIATLAEDAVGDFAATVRARLSDLAPDEVDDLTDGLEADLLDRIADSGEDLGDPVAYADELRAAAGIPPRPPASGRRTLAGLRSGAGAAWRQWLSGHPRMRGVVDFLASLRPAWWVFRAVLLWFFVVQATDYQPDPFSFVSLLFLAGCIVVSAQWGRGKWLPWRWLRPATAVCGVILVLCIPFLVSRADGIMWNRWYGGMPDYSSEYQSGVWQDGQQVTNLFAYDANGDPIPGVRLFTQDGQPLETTGGQGDAEVIWSDQGLILGDPEATRSPYQWRNAYPLWQAPVDDDTGDATLPRSATPAPFPYPSVPAIPTPERTTSSSTAALP